MAGEQQWRGSCAVHGWVSSSSSQCPRCADADELERLRELNTNWEHVATQAVELNGTLRERLENACTPLVEHIERLRRLEDKTGRAEPSTYQNDTHPAAAAGDIAAYRLECEAVLRKMRELERAPTPERGQAGTGGSHEQD
jgi:hypothetical protein